MFAHLDEVFDIDGLVEHAGNRIRQGKQAAIGILRSACHHERGRLAQCAGQIARIAIGQIMLSLRTKDQHETKAVEAFRRAKFKFPGRQKIVVSRQWGFTKFSREDYLAWKAQGRICPDGVNAKLWENHGPIAERKPETLFLTPARVYKERNEA